MKNNPYWEANRTSANPEIPRIWCNTKVHYRLHKRPPVRHLSLSRHQINPGHYSPFQFLYLQYIILPSKTGSSKLSLSTRSQHQNLIGISPVLHTWPMSLPSYPWFNNPINIWQGVPVMQFFLMAHPPALCFLFLLRPKYLYSLPLFSPCFYVCCLLNRIKSNS